MRIPQELQALGNKKAATLATAFEVVLRPLVKHVVPASGSAADPPVWFVHILVGDGINTNEADAKQLWANGRSVPFLPNGRYFLLVIKCGNHQAALSASFAVVGPPAKAACATCETVMAKAVRLYKYLLGFYYSNFVQSTQDWAYAHFADRPPLLGALELIRNL